MKNHAYIFSALFIAVALLPLPEFTFEKQSVSSPKPRHLEEIAFDKEANTLYLFGGVEFHTQGWSEPVDIFEYSGHWKQYSTKAPFGRRGHALIVDEASHTVLLLGGVAQTKSGNDTVLLDMWRWSNGNWKTINSVCPVKEPRAVYDPNAKRVLVYGDSHDLSNPWAGGDDQKFELWEFKNERWSKLSDLGPTGGQVPVVYNIKEKSLSLLQWKDSNHLVVWHWKANQWQSREFTSDIPPQRSKYALSYSTNERALFLFGGVDSKRELLDDFWKFNGTAWTKLESSSMPSARASLRMIDAGDRLLLYGGTTKSGLTNELWEFKNNTWTKH